MSLAKVKLTNCYRFFVSFLPLSFIITFSFAFDVSIWKTLVQPTYISMYHDAHFVAPLPSNVVRQYCETIKIFIYFWNKNVHILWKSMYNYFFASPSSSFPLFNRLALSAASSFSFSFFSFSFFFFFFFFFSFLLLLPLLWYRYLLFSFVSKSKVLKIASHFCQN